MPPMSFKRPLLLPSGLFFALLITVNASDTPYTPLTLFSTKQRGSPLIYILDPPNPSSSQGRLRSLYSNTRLSSGDIPSDVLSNTLPFLEQDPTSEWTASLDDEGSIAVVVGQCTAGTPPSAVWKFTPNPRSQTGNGTWSHRTVNTAGASGDHAQASINYLASSIAFSLLRDADASIYTFGGMCPNSGGAPGEWVSDATYSNKVVILEPDSQSEYDFEIGSSRGPPIAEAGFSVTPLQPTYSNGSNGEQSTAQSFLLLGGHTQHAFINMSQVALFSLPQASWTFLPIGSENEKTDLMPRGTASGAVEPRSGHTALLTLDGSKVVVYGGWVGDVSSPASPQLAVLEVGAGYGGSGQWAWSAKSAQPSLASGANGLYGHGATMLDGDVMMVMGGYETVGTAARRKRAFQGSNTQNLFYNVTADQWIPSYSPKLAQSGIAADHSAGPLATKDQRIGLATGLPLGLLAVGLFALAAWIFSKRFRRRPDDDGYDQELREKEIEDLDATANPYNDNVFDHLPTHNGSMGPYAAGVWDGRTQQYSYGHEVPPNVWRGESVREAERTGLDIDVPSPHRGLRRSMGGRGHQSTPMYSDRPSGGLSTIHRIEERDEDEDALISTGPEPEDPFQDPSHPVGPPPRDISELSTTVVGKKQASPPGQHIKDKHGWVQDWATATSNRVMAGRVSPTKSDRTMSSLSERSTRSEASAVSSASGKGKGIPRRPPGRSLRILPAAFNPFATSDSGSPTHDGSPSGRRTPGSTTTVAADADSFTTANSTFATLQAESDALLGPARPGQAQPPYVVEPDNEPTFTRSGGHRAPSTKVGSWVGSVKRVINHAGRSASLTMASARAADMPTSGPDGLGGLMVYETRGSNTSSPTKKGGVSALATHGEMQAAKAGTSEGWTPQRSVSDGASLWAAKRGAKDWAADNDVNRRTSSFVADTRPGWGVGAVVGGESAGPTPGSSRPLTSSGITNGDDASEEWDVEAAVEERSVQVMFSVPKEKLRVVNAEVEASSISDAGGLEEYEPERDGQLGSEVVMREDL